MGPQKRDESPWKPLHCVKAFGREVYPQEVVAQVGPSVKSILHLKWGLFYL